MLYVLGIATAALIVLAQSLWKAGVDRLGFSLSGDFIMSSQMLKLVTSPFIIGGVIIYAVATLAFFGLLAKYQYAHAQTIVVSASLIFTFLSAALIFGQSFKLVHLLGLACLIAGVILITKL